MGYDEVFGVRPKWLNGVALDGEGFIVDEESFGGVAKGVTGDDENIFD